jgi:GAF domain-containing protein
VTRVLELGVTPDFEVVPPVQRPAYERLRLEVVSILEETVERAIALDGAQRGSAQIVDPENAALRLIAAPGFSGTFRSFFDSVHDEVGASCGVAAADLRIIAVPDVTASAIFVGTPSLDVLIDEGARSCISIPVVVDGVLVGMFSTHHDEPHRWRVEDVRALQALAASIAPELAPDVAA